MSFPRNRRRRTFLALLSALVATPTVGLTTTYMTIDKGGAINQGSGVYTQDVTGNCSFPVPLSGNWSGTAVHITSTGGACNAGYILTMDGTASGAYGTAEWMSGTYRISYSGVFSGVDVGTWTATLSH